MEEQRNFNTPQQTPPPCSPYAQPRPQWTPPPKPVYAAGKRELLFGLALLVCSVLMWDFILAGGFSLGFSIGAVCVIVCSAAYLLSRGHRPDWYSGSLIVLSIAIAAAFGRSADGFVKYVMVHFLLLAMNLALCLMAGQNRRGAAGLTSLLDAPRALFVLGFGSMGAAGRGVNQARKNAGSFGKKGGALAVGLLAAVPLVAVLVSLLTQADAAFEGMLGKLPQADWNEYVTAVIFGSGFGWVLYCRNVALHRAPRGGGKTASRKGIPALTVNTVLGAACLVYCAYLLSQLAYLAGGLSGILPENFTMAEYARRGFFEMAWLCAINLTVIGVGAGLVAKERKAPLLTRLLCLFIGLVTLFLVVTASAKMLMYIESYGLTRLRVLTEVIMVWLGLSTALVCLWLFLPKMPYMKAVVLLALAMGAAVIWTDVDTQVAKYNVRAYQSGALDSVDVEHLTWLGPGAVPYIRELTEDADPEVAEAAKDYLDDCAYSVTDFRDWNLAKAQADRTLRAMRAAESAEAAACLTERLGLEIPAAEVQKREGLDGLEEKGQTYLELRLSEDQAAGLLPRLEAAAAQNGAWHRLPLHEDLRAVLYAIRVDCPSFLTDWESRVLPDVKEGYYFFLDRHPEAIDPCDQALFLEREDYYFTIAVYDTADNTLYYLTMDTPAAEETLRCADRNTIS